MYLSNLIYLTPESKAAFGDLYFSDDFDDAVLIDDTYDNSVCFVAFRGSTGETLKNFIRDWKQNLRVKRERFCNKEDPTVCCDKTHKGFKQGYDTNYRDAFETKLEQVCNGRDWIFTGHSQGAGIAQVAALRYAHKDPLLLLFATTPAPFGQGNTCLGNLLSRTTLNYFNTKAAGVIFKKLRYDPITFPYHLKLGGYSEGHSKLKTKEV
jgi:pimeloyl-ACP methyl ester carboxylesterase